MTEIKRIKVISYFVKKSLRIIYEISKFTPLVLIYLLKAILIDWILSLLAFRKIHKIALEMGLKHKKSHYIKEFGQIQGKLNNHYITSKPFESNPSIDVEFNTKHLKLDISTYKYNTENQKNTLDFKTKSFVFNNIFKTKRIHKSLLERITNNQEIISNISVFYTKWIFSIESFSISESYIHCKLRYGFMLFPYIPSKKFRSLLLDLSQIAEIIDLSL